jgi:hypothetical protein
MEGEGERKGRQGEKGKREGKWEVKEKRIGREGEGKREGCRDKGWGRWGGKIGVRKNFFFPNGGKHIKTSLSYFYLPFLLNFATFSVQSSLPFP